LKNLDPDHILAILNLRMGDLFLTKQNNHGRPPVIGFFEYMEGVKTITRLNEKSAYFKPVQEGSVGIYFRKNILSAKSIYWAKFHEVWIDGKKCVIHEHFIDPLPKGKQYG
tara:strand:- start:1700 stop:2032 length:333 start_codon:yes stop_codon:yes gene_type:complete